VASIEIEVGALVLRRGVFLFVPPNWGRVAGRPGSDLGGTVPLSVGTEMCVRRVVTGLTIHWEFCSIGGNINNLIFTYTPRVLCVPSPLRFYPWVGVYKYK